MKRLPLLLPLLFPLVGFCHAANLDVEAVGRDLDGWSGGVARIPVSGGSFEISRPVTATDEGGNLVVTTVIRERKRGSRVFEGTLRALVSPDGLVRTLSVAGKVDGRAFETGEVSRPEPAPPLPVSVGQREGEGEQAETAVEPAPAPPDPERQMRDSLAAGLRVAIERARASDKVIKRDLSAWIFSSSASSGDVLAEGVDAIVGSILRHSGPLTGEGRAKTRGGERVDRPDGGPIQPPAPAGVRRFGFRGRPH